MLAATLTAAALVATTAASAEGAHNQRGAVDNTIKIWTVAYGGGNQDFSALQATFAKANPGVKFQYTIRPDQQIKDSIRQVVLSSKSPDVFQIWSGEAFSRYFARNNAVIPLDKYYKQYGWDKTLIPSEVKFTELNGKRYGVPWAVNSIGVFYRKDAFAKAGITSTPTTYAELIADNAKLKDAGITPLSIGGKFSWNTMFLLDNLIERSCGSKTFDALRALKVKWTGQTCLVDAYTELRKWVTNGWLPQDFEGLDPNSGESTSLMYAGQAAMVFQGSWLVPGITQDKQDPTKYGFFTFPTGTGRQYAGVEQLMVSAKAKNPDLVAKFLNYALSPAVQTKYFGKLNAPTSPTRAAKPPADRSPLGPVVDQTLRKNSGLFVTTDLSLPADVYGSYFQAQDDVASGKIDPSAAPAVVQKAIDQSKQ